MRHYNNDPRWMRARFSSKCTRCERTIKKNEQIYYYPASRTAICHECGEQGQRDFEATAFDEAVYNGNTW